MKKLLSVLLVVLLMLCMSAGLSSCLPFFCDPKGKEWHNFASLPNISNPFHEIYDGSYSIQIDEDGKVAFKPLDGEVIEGILSASTNIEDFTTDISIQFENGKTATGQCYTTDTGRILTVIYNGERYEFSDKRQLSKEEFETYRSQFIEFLTNVYRANIFPSEQEIAGNSLYRQFTNYFQIDPCCNGPFVYDTVERATIEKIELKEHDNQITLHIDGKSVNCEIREENFISMIENGELKELALSDLKEGECLVIVYRNSQTYSIDGIFYMENS